MNKLLAFPLMVLLPLTSVAKCDPSETATDHSVTCHQPNGYVQAGAISKAKKGTFYGCLKNSKPCVIKYKLAGRKKEIKLYTSDLFTIPKKAHGWTTDNCGTIYKKK